MTVLILKYDEFALSPLYALYIYRALHKFAEYHHKWFFLHRPLRFNNACRALPLLRSLNYKTENHDSVIAAVCLPRANILDVLWSLRRRILLEYGEKRKIYTIKPRECYCLYSTTRKSHLNIVYVTQKCEIYLWKYHIIISSRRKYSVHEITWNNRGSRSREAISRRSTKRFHVESRKKPCHPAFNFLRRKSSCRARNFQRSFSRDSNGVI